MSASELNARSIFLEALSACNIERALAEKLTVEVQPAFDLRGICRLTVIAMGKAGASMLAALVKRTDIVTGRELRGVLVAPQPLEPMPSGFTFYRGAHPLPGESSFEAARAILKLLQSEPPGADALCFFLISGGASAMVELPLDPSISVEDTIAFHRTLVHSGASIAEMNCVRKHFSAVKGGRLALRAAQLRQLSLLVSDVAPQHIGALASGPTLPDSSTVADCRAILARYDLLPQLPHAVAQFFSATTLPETPKPEQLSTPYLVLLSSEDLARHASGVAESRRYTVVIDNTCDDWDYRDAAQYLLERVRMLRRAHKRLCLISAGEISVHVPPAHGSGGRNQHFVLYAATQMQQTDHGLTILSCGSDGIDGNSPAAGAVLSFDGLSQHPRESWIPSAEEALRTFASYPLLHAEGRTIETGPTGNNLRDLRLFLCD